MASSTTTTTSSDPTSYEGNCHCGLFRFTLNLPTPIAEVRTCNCSICSRRAEQWIYPIPASSFIIHCGEDKLTSYEFGKHYITHHFCPVCGSSPYGRIKDADEDNAISVNARLLANFSSLNLIHKKIGGADYGTPYAAPAVEDFPVIPKPVAASTPYGKQVTEAGNLTTYYSNCHCKAVKITILTKPLEESEAISCNCSLCSRVGEIYIYPAKSHVAISGEENLTGYDFLSKESLHSFCKTCGVSMCVVVTEEGADIVPINVRCINGVDLGKLKVKKYDGASAGKPYTMRN